MGYGISQGDKMGVSSPEGVLGLPYVQGTSQIMAWKRNQSRFLDTLHTSFDQVS